MDSLKNANIPAGTRLNPVATAQEGLAQLQAAGPQLIVSLEHGMMPTAIRQAQALEQALAVLQAARPVPSGAQIMAMNAVLRPVFAAYGPVEARQENHPALKTAMNHVAVATHKVCLISLVAMLGGMRQGEPAAAPTTQVLGAMQQVLASVIHKKTRLLGQEILAKAYEATTPAQGGGSMSRPKARPEAPRASIAQGLSPPPASSARQASMASRSQARAEQQAVPSMAPAALMATQSPRPRLGRQPPAFMHVGVRDAKHKFVPRHIYEAVAPRFGNHRFSHLWAERDLGILTPSIASGAWGKVRFLLTEANELLAVKELRTEYKPGFNKLGHTKTQASDLKAAKDEVEFTIKTRRIVDAGLKQALFSRLAVTRSALTPVTISRVITDRIKPKVYVVMNREAGTLEQLKQNIPEALNATLALSFAAQGFAELGLFHDGAHTAHMDLKPDNVLVSQGGQLKLMDLGLAQSLIDNQTPNRGICGSIVSPEMVFSRPEGLPNLGVANDVWAMGVMVVSLAAPAGTPNPFQPSATTLRSAAERDMSYEEHMVQVFTDYSEWYFEHSDAAGNLDVRGIRPDGQGSFSDFFAPLATQNPALCDILFAEVLFITPEDRTGATELGQLIMALLPESPTPAFAALQGAAQDLDKSAGVDALVEHATQYRAWEQVYQSAALASPPPAARGPRPLPG